MKRSHWAVLITALAILLLYLAPPLANHAKARPQRIQTVNGVWNLTFTLTNNSLSNWNTAPPRQIQPANRPSL